MKHFNRSKSFSAVLVCAAAALSLSVACSSAGAPMGLIYQYELVSANPVETIKGGGCRPPDGSSGTSISSISGSWSTAPSASSPHFLFSVGRDDGNDLFDVQVLRVTLYKANTMVPSNFSVIKAAAYNEAFTAASGTEKWEAPIGGGTLKVEILGVPQGRRCELDEATKRYVVR